ncbi:recombinase family protein, partial [Oleiphilus sp. HI0117]
SPAKGSGLLNNELYRGRHIWNRSQWTKDPDSGKRVRIERSESEWSINEREDLRIVTEELWEKVRARFKESRYKGGIKGKGGRVRSLLGGLMSCGKCGAPIVVVSSHSYGCSNRMNRGPSICEGVNVNRKETEQKLLTEIQDMLQSDELVEFAYVESLKVLNELSAGKGDSRKALLQRIDELDKEIERYIEAIGAIGISGSIAEKLKSAEFEKIQINEQLSQESEETELPELSVIKKLYKAWAFELQESRKNSTNETRDYLKDILREVEINKEGS